MGPPPHLADLACFGPVQVAHLKALGDALPGTLELWDADLLHEGAFDDVVKCVLVPLHLQYQAPACFKPPSDTCIGGNVYLASRTHDSPAPCHIELAS